MTTKTSKQTISFYRDSRRPQGWGGFFLALWMAIYIGGKVPLWLIAIGVLLTMTIFIIIVIKFRPKQEAAYWDGRELVERRFILPPKHYLLNEPPRVVRHEADIAAVEFSDGAGKHEVYIIYDEALEQQLEGTDIVIKDNR
ncbi:hypothetical protein [Idiomarina sp.]|uniref:hypothetical protein n=1 Tax=Idiomarina sp. TaxID=1874361 RepID=UPI0025C3AD12|nr:hypothetical protein [Idiomarina sp.]NQZ05071.1 hypothetical protein [Idiomarina sp.]|tara:strand:+ start:412 stop:834 length:423 start_codon:yes stop_codon:yes gene_type:complete